MATLKLSSIVVIKLKHSFLKDNTLYYRRRVPDDLRSHYGGKAMLVVSLQTADPAIAARKIDQLTAQHDLEFKQHRNPSRETATALARALLSDHGINPNAPQTAPENVRWSFEDTIDALLPQAVLESACDPYARLTGTDLDKHLAPVHRAALQLYQGRRQHLASDCLSEYTAARSKKEQARKLAAYAFRPLLDLCGDLPLSEYSRSDANRVVKHLLDNGNKTATVVRRVNVLRAAFERSIREHELPITRNIWSGLEIQDKGKDAKPRDSFTVDDYRQMFAAIDSHSSTHGLDDRRCLLTLLACTGARLAEITGLLVSDVVVDGPTPHLVIQEHPHRSLKTSHSARVVPLATPRAVAAAQAALALARGSAHLFPRYSSPAGTNATAASATLNKWLKTSGLDGLTNHSLRHGMRDLLRAIECPTDIANELQGWERKGIGSQYGKGTPLTILAKWLSAALATASSSL